MVSVSDERRGAMRPRRKLLLPLVIGSCIGAIVGACFGLAEAAETQPAYGEWGVALEHIDANVDPGDDFFRYVNGAWLEQAEIPADMPSAGVGVELHLKAEADVERIILDLAKRKAERGSVEQQVGDLYASWMDTGRRDRLGAKPLLPHLAEIDAVDSREALMGIFGSIHHAAPFAVSIIPDPADTTRYVAVVAQGGLGMPARDYYLEDGERFAAYREAYRAYIERMLALAGIDDAKHRAEGILSLETRLAEVHWPPEDSRDIRRIYNPMNVAGLEELVPQVAWQDIFDSIGLGKVRTFIVAQTSAPSSPKRRCRPGRTTSPFISSTRVRRSFRRRSTARTSISIQER